jgi:alpha-glucosidase (family GH31 glycosyl hydrolase)
MSRTRLARVVALWVVATGALALPDCACGAVRQTMAGVDVVVDPEQGRLTLRRGDDVLLDVPASRVGAKHGAPFYDMQFGMFDIQEDATPWAFAATLELKDPPTPDHVSFTWRDDAGNPVADGALTEARGGLELVVVVRGDNNQAIVGSACPFHHAIGFGAQSADVDHVGQRVPLWVSEPGIGKVDTDELPLVWQVVGRRHTSSAPIPAFVADNNAAYVVDVDSFARVDMCATDADEVTFEAFQPTLLLRIWGADSVREAQAKMVDSFGRPPLPPPFTFAPWNDAIFGSDNVRAVAARLRELDMPSSVIWTEDWRGGSDAGGGLYRLDEDWGVDPELYPDFDDMVADVNALGFEEMVYFNTFVVTDADIFDEVTSNGWTIADGDGAPLLFSGPDKDFLPTGLLDLTNDEARAFMKGHLKAALDSGVRGWMADFAEWQPVEDGRGARAVLASGEDPALAHNRYPVLWQQLNREVLEETGHLDDSVVFVRSAWLGSQPLAQVVWAGDQRTSFQDDDGLPTILPMGIGMATVGFPFFTHDIAGYQSASNDPVDQELFFRWTSLGALSPVMRTHHGTHVALNVNFDTNDDTRNQWRRWAQLHMRLYPYLRRLAIDATRAGGLPLWVPLPLLFPDDESTWSIRDEVMLGPSILVAPVVSQGATERAVRLPPGRWAVFAPFYDCDGCDVVDGPAVATVPAPLAELPMFLPAGAIVPLTAEPADTLLPSSGDLRGIESTEGDRFVVVALGADGSFEEESGASYTLEGSGTTRPSAGADGVIVVTGDDVVTGDGFTFTLAGHPAGRTTRILFR